MRSAVFEPIADTPIRAADEQARKIPARRAKPVDPAGAAGRMFKFLFLALWLMVSIFPLYWIIITAFKTPGSIFSQPVDYYPTHFTWDNFAGLFRETENGKIILYFWNSFWIATVAAVLGTTISMFAGYALARFQFRTKGAVLLGFLTTQMLPGFVALGPLYQMMNAFGLTDSMIGLVLLYGTGSVAFSTILLRAFFSAAPESLEEAALIDGCTRAGALFRVILPVMLPGVVVTYVLNWIGFWNELFLAIIMINSDSNRTLPVALNSFVSSFQVEWGPLAATALVSMLPPLILFAFANKYIISGLATGALRG